MKNLPQILTIANMVIMVFLIILIAMQNRSSGLSTVFGGSGGIVQTRRGVEKWLFFTTIAFIVLFVGLSIATVLISK
jgi:protein translocase SecG subunit